MITRSRGSADRLIPAGWRWRASLARHVDGRYELLHRPTGARLAWIVPEYDDDPPWDADFDIVPGLGLARSWVVADGNMVTRWYTLDDAVLYAAQPRGHWDRPWPLSGLQFWGDRLRRPWPILQYAAAAAVIFAGRGQAPLWLVLLAALAAVQLVGHLLPGDPCPDEFQYHREGEVDGWPDDPRWSALFDSTVWDPRETTELVWTLDDMRAALGPPEHMADPHARARYLLDCDLLVAATRNRQET